MITTETAADALRREIAVLRDELAMVSGGFEARVQRRLALTEEIERLRAEVGMNRVRSREQRDEVLRLRTELASSHSHRRDLQDQLDGAKNRLRVDGQLLTDLIIGACPMILTDEAAARIARDAVDELVRVGPGVTVFRGHPDNPWLLRCDDLRSDGDAPRGDRIRITHTDGCMDACAPADEVVDATILDDPDERDVEYAVFTGPTTTEHPFCVAEANSYADAARIRAHVSGSWIGQRVVITQRWTPVDTEDPNR
jgi:uncharacterized small protein (DUF1192 family)